MQCMLSTQWAPLPLPEVVVQPKCVSIVMFAVTVTVTCHEVQDLA